MIHTIVILNAVKDLYRLVKILHCVQDDSY